MILKIKNTIQRKEDKMSDYIQVGSIVQDFKLETFEPLKGDFGEVSLETLKANKKWTILLFYPADFTFV